MNNSIGTTATKQELPRIPYDLPAEIVEEYRRILIITRQQYDTILSFLQDKKMWGRQVERSKKPRNGYECTLQMNTTHYQSGKDCALILNSALATVDIFGTKKPAPWTECEGAVYARGWARIKKIPELEEIPHIFLSLMDNNEIMGMYCGRVVLICEDPTAPTLVDLGLCKSNKEIEEERREEEERRQKDPKEEIRDLAKDLLELGNACRRLLGMEPLKPGEKDTTDYYRRERQEEACIRAAQKMERRRR